MTAPNKTPAATGDLAQEAYKLALMVFAGNVVRDVRKRRKLTGRVEETKENIRAVLDAMNEYKKEFEEEVNRQLGWGD
jgi:gamma-glutamylcyclotransferase (GGCT)/AIG2-like uncharacterized protein YtfP